MTENIETTDETGGIDLSTRTTCELEGVDDEWNTANMECGDEIEEAIRTVREDREESVTVADGSLWMFRVYWNENTDSVWVGRFAYHGGMEVVEESD